MENNTKKTTPYSIHTFMWSFRWSAKEKNGNDVLNLFSECLLKDIAWKETGFKLSNQQHYNEYVYYHSYVRDTLFANRDNKNVIRYFNYGLNGEETFEFEVITKKNDNGDVLNKELFNLAIKGISLHLFFTGIGILTFQLENNDHTTIEEIQLINDFGRRTYPQYLGNGSKDHEKGVEATKRAFLPTYIKVSYCTDEETFEAYDKFESVGLHEVVQPPAYIKALFRNDFVFSEKVNPDKNKITITHLTDDRMFTLCWYPDPGLSNELKTISNQKYSYLTAKKWYELIFCDSNQNLTCQNDAMLQEHIQKYTYERWVNYGTLYGITRDCLFCLTDGEKFARNVILPHMQSIYYQMSVLCLAQRASIQKFSYDLGNIKHTALDSQTKIDSLELQKQYLRFNNKLYFKEVTDQIQGIEIYQLMQKAMNIENVANQLDREIEELHNLLNMEESLQLSKDANTLTKIATYAVPASLAMALFALFSGDLDFSKEILWGKAYAIGVLVILSFIILFFGKKITNKIINKK